MDPPLLNLQQWTHHFERFTRRDGGWSAQSSSLWAPIRADFLIQEHAMRKDGHGFGLHSSALAAQLLGGRLTLESEGPGKGAVATRELPL